MHNYTIVANTQHSALFVSFQKKKDARFIAELLTGNPDATAIPRILTASNEFKQRLCLLDVFGESFYEPKRFFYEIPENQHFIFLPGHIDDRIRIYLSALEICRIDNVPLKSPDLGIIAPFLYNHYEMRVFDGSPENRKRIGEKDKSKRVCRFCGGDISMPNVKFTEKAHAISESIGNKGLICLEECDGCNTRFNDTIEQDIGNLLRFQLVVKGIKGKNGNPTLKGDEVSIKNDTTSRSKLGRDTIVIKFEKSPESFDPKEISKYLSQQYSFSQVKYTPQNIYKCLCKYVMSLMDSRFLPCFKNTIDWINEPLTRRSLPPIWYNSVPSREYPYLAIMTRKHNNKELPYCWAILCVAGIRFSFIVPFCSFDDYKFVRGNHLNYFINNIESIMPDVKQHPIWLNSVMRVSTKIQFNFVIPSDCVEGRDYYLIDV